MAQWKSTGDVPRSHIIKILVKGLDFIQETMQNHWGEMDRVVLYSFCLERVLCKVKNGLEASGQNSRHQGAQLESCSNGLVV